MGDVARADCADCDIYADSRADSRVPHDAYRPTFVKSLVMVPVPQQQPIAAIGAYWQTHHEATWNEQYDADSKWGRGQARGAFGVSHLESPIFDATVNAPEPKA